MNTPDVDALVEGLAYAATVLREKRAFLTAVDVDEAAAALLALRDQRDAAEARAKEMEARYDRLTLDFAKRVAERDALREALETLVEVSGNCHETWYAGDEPTPWDRARAALSPAEQPTGGA